jgi:hypothetical protein
MFLTRTCSFASLVMFTGLLGSAHASIIYNESVNGDLSGNGLAPTSVTVALGSNQVFGSTGKNTDQVVDRDYLTFTVPAFTAWTGLTVLPGTSTVGALSFIGLQAGNQVTLPVAPATAAGLLGWRHFSTSDINTDILAEMGVPSNGSTGFTGGLGPGSYSLWIQETGAGSSLYGFDIILTPIPEPGTYAMMGIALACLGLLCRRWVETQNS